MPVTDQDRERWTRELMRALDVIDRIRAEKKAAVSDFNAELVKTQTEVDHYRALLAGKEGEQVPLALEVLQKAAKAQRSGKGAVGFAPKEEP